MAKFNISFNGNSYSIDESALSSASTELQSHLSTVMNGTGATIKIDGTTYNVDATKLANARNTFVAHLGTVSGSGSKVVVNGTEYSVDSTKLNGAIADLQTVLGGLHSDEGQGGSNLVMNEYGFYFGEKYSATNDGIKGSMVFYQDGSVETFEEDVSLGKQPAGSVTYRQCEILINGETAITVNSDGTQITFVANGLVMTLETDSDGGSGGGSGDTDEGLGVDAATGEILDSWEQIIAAVNNGTYATRYSVGNYKPLDLGSEGVVNMQIAAIDGDVMSDGSGNAHITWIAKELLATVHNMNNEYTNANGWAASEMRTYLQSDIWALIQTDVQNAIVAVDKTYYDYTTKSTLTCSDKVWIPSFREVNYGSKAEDSGVIYSELFTNANARIKNLNGSAAYWWLRSAESVDNIGSSEHFWIVFSMGLINSGAAAFKYGVALSFCF